MKKFDVTCFGEILIDFTPFGTSPAGMRLFEQNPGGAPGNVAVALARLGHSSAFIGKIGSDSNGTFLRQSLDGAGVDTAGLMTDPGVNTSMAFVTLSDAGERDFSFVRDADTRLTIEELGENDCKIFHFGSLSMTHQPARDATWEALHRARTGGAIISYDPNYRPLLWNDQETAVRSMVSVLDRVDVLKVSEEEVALLTGEADPERGGRILLGRGPSCVAVTRGERGAILCHKWGAVHIKAFPATVADTTGAGDAFMGGLLSGLLTRNLHPADMTEHDAREIGRFANAVAACCVAARGGIPAMPTIERVTRLLENHLEGELS